MKREEFLQPLSREHHHGLLLGWKIKSGFRKQVDISRIKAYADWFFRNHLLPHFDVEENHVFSILGNDHDLVKTALSEHQELRRLFEDSSNVIDSLNRIPELLEAHIRFEERILFNEIQLVATPKDLEDALARHAEPTTTCAIGEWPDEFWK